MKAWGMSIASERKQRALSKELVGSNLASEAALFLYFQWRVAVKSSDLLHLCMFQTSQLLEQNDRYL